VLQPFLQVEPGMHCNRVTFVMICVNGGLSHLHD
jgi:hypothetical protein